MYVGLRHASQRLKVLYVLGFTPYPTGSCYNPTYASVAFFSVIGITNISVQFPFQQFPLFQLHHREKNGGKGSDRSYRVFSCVQRLLLIRLSYQLNFELIN